MLRFVTILIFSFALSTSCFLNAEDKPLHIHILSGATEYHATPSLKAWQKRMEDGFPGQFVFTATWAEDKIKDAPGIADVAKANLLVIFCRRWELPEEQMKFIREHFTANKPALGIRTASHAFNNWDDFDAKIWGGSYKGHGKDAKVKVTLVPENKDHPILEGITEWTRKGKLYYNKKNSPKTIPLLQGTEPKNSEPLTWVHPYSETGLAFYTSMGLPEDFQNKNFDRLLLNAIMWTCKIKLDLSKDKAAPKE